MMRMEMTLMLLLLLLLLKYSHSLRRRNLLPADADNPLMCR